MTLLEMINWMANACYGFLTANFLWGLSIIIISWRRLGQLSFRTMAAEEEFVEELSGMLSERQYKAAAEKCDFDFRALPRLCLLMIANRERPYAELRQLVANNVQRSFLGDMEHRLGQLVTVIKSGPLLGLLGTVLGMMAAFGRIGTGEKVQPSQIADEISVALICTAMGLGTAIPFGYILSFLSIRTRALQESLEANLPRILYYFRHHEGR